MKVLFQIKLAFHMILLKLKGYKVIFEKSEYKKYKNSSWDSMFELHRYF